MMNTKIHSLHLNMCVENLVGLISQIYLRERKALLTF